MAPFCCVHTPPAAAAARGGWHAVQRLGAWARRAVAAGSRPRHCTVGFCRAFQRHFPAGVVRQPPRRVLEPRHLESHHRWAGWAARRRSSLHALPLGRCTCWGPPALAAAAPPHATAAVIPAAAGECWLKWQKDWDGKVDLAVTNLAVNSRGRYPPEYRREHRTSPGAAGSGPGWLAGGRLCSRPQVLLPPTCARASWPPRCRDGGVDRGRDPCSTAVMAAI